MTKKNKKVPWYKKIKSPISIELSFEDGNFNIGASVDIGPFGVEVSTFDGGTFGLGVGVFDIEVEGDGSGKIGMLFDTFEMTVTRKGCSYIKETSFQGFVYHTEVQKIEGCKTDEEKEREKDEEENENEEDNEIINEDEEEESEDQNEDEEDNEEEESEDQNEDEEDNKEEESEDQNEDEEENKEEEDKDQNEDEENNEEEESEDQKNDDDISDEMRKKYKIRRDILEFDIKSLTILDGIDIKASPTCRISPIETPDKPLYIGGNQNQNILALVTFLDISMPHYYNYDPFTKYSKFWDVYEVVYTHFKFLDIKELINALSSKSFLSFFTSIKNKEAETIKGPEGYFNQRYDSLTKLSLVRFLSPAFFSNRIVMGGRCSAWQYEPEKISDINFRLDKESTGLSPENYSLVINKVTGSIPIGGYYELSLPGGSFLPKPYYYLNSPNEPTYNRDGSPRIYRFRPRCPIFFLGTRKDINRRLKEIHDVRGYNFGYNLADQFFKGTFDYKTVEEYKKYYSLIVPDGGFKRKFARVAKLLFEIPQEIPDFDIIPSMETEKCCFTPDDREALMFNQRALQDLSTALGVQPRPKSDTSQSQSEEDKAAAAKAAVGFPFPVNDISNPKMISTFNGLKYSKKIEEHDEININNYRELLLEILKLIQEQSMGFGVPKLRLKGFGVPKNAMEPTTDTSDDRAYDFVGIFARMFAAIIENGIPGPINLITKKGKEIIESQVYTNKEYFETLFALVAENLQVTRRNQITIIKLAQLGTTLHKISLVTYRFIRHVLIPGLGIPFKRSVNPDESVKHGQYNSYFTPFNFSNIIQKGFGGANSDEGIEMNPNFKPKTEDIDQTHDEVNVPGNGYLSSVFLPGKTANLWMQIKALMKKSK